MSFLIGRGTFTALDWAALVIHEAGHFFFSPFGPALHIAGGTIMQVGLPALLVWHFAVHRYRTGVQVSLFWLGHNLLNISVYAGDARARQLPLLGGDRAGHDWWNMLGALGMLEYDAVVSGLFVGSATLVFATLCLLPRWMEEPVEALDPIPV